MSEKYKYPTNLYIYIPILFPVLFVSTYIDTCMYMYVCIYR